MKVYIIVNSDLGMTKGKTCSQVGHSIADLTRYLEKTPTSDYLLWKHTGEAMVVLKAPQASLEFFVGTYSNKKRRPWCVSVVDAGLTQVKTGDLTVVAFCPSDDLHFLSGLKLL